MRQPDPQAEPVVRKRGVVKRGDWKRVRRTLIPVYGLLLVAGLGHYLDWLSASCVTAGLALVFTPAYGVGPGRPIRYAIAAALIFLVYLFIPVKTVLYFGLAASVFCFRESFYGRMAPSSLFAVVLMTPLMEYFMNLLSFPIRLRLTAAAGVLLHMTGSAVEVDGNLLRVDGSEFSVDPACMGLHMLLVSLGVGLLLINIYQSRYRRGLGIIAVLVFLLLVLASNLLMNVCRIVALVSFHILPENPMHGVTGILCLLVYVILPSMLVGRWMVRRYGRELHVETGMGIRREKRILLTNMVLAAAMGAAVIIGWTRQTPGHAGTGAVGNSGGYTVTGLGDHVLQCNNGRAMVYLKFIRDFYYTDHQPTICWRGSGYDFSEIREEQLGGMKIYTGKLRHGDDTLYTAWWYDNGYRRCMSQLDWRWDMLRGGHAYALVNLTAASRQEMEHSIQELQEKNLFRDLIQKGY